MGSFMPEAEWEGPIVSSRLTIDEALFGAIVTTVGFRRGQ